MTTRSIDVTTAASAGFAAGGGKVTTDLGGASDMGRSIVVQGDGKILVAGYALAAGAQDFGVVRYNADGTLDTSFAGDGVLTTDFGGNDLGYSIALQSDGRILVAGSSGGNAAVARYLGDGRLDTTFAGDGTLTADFGGGDTAFGMTLQLNGRFVIVGVADAGSGWRDRYDRFVVARYNTNGTADKTFAGDGADSSLVQGWGYGVALQGDGKVVVAGQNNSNFGVVRYNADGSLDTTFDGDGLASTDFGPQDEARSLVIQSDGKILVAGSTRIGNDWDFALARYNADGTLDTSFDGDGKITTDFGGQDYAQQVILQPDGRILVAGYSDNGFYGADGDFVLARYNADGSLDTSFNDNGLVVTDFGGEDRGYGVALLANGKILVSGGRRQLCAGAVQSGREPRRRLHSAGEPSPDRRQSPDHDQRRPGPGLCGIRLRLP